MDKTVRQRDLPPHRGREARLEILGAPVSTHRVETYVLPRDTCGPDDATAPATRVFLALPKAAPLRRGFPVLYLLDGNAAFDHLTPALLEAVPDLVVAGIGYDTDQQFARAQRTFDYSPPVAPGAAPRPDPHHPDRRAGGAEQFLARLTGPIRAEVESRLRIDPARRMLWGHSFGGLFTFYTAMTRPDAFSRYAAISPSIWWDEDLAAGLVRARRLQPRQRTRLCVGMGDSEQRTGSSAPARKGPPPQTMALLNTLCSLDGLEMQLTIYPEAVHIATLGASLPETLRMAAA